MKQYVSQYTAKDLGQMMAMPGYLHEAYSWRLLSLSGLDYDRTAVTPLSGVIINTDNSPGAQVASGYLSVGTSDWEVVNDDGGVTPMTLGWTDSDNSSWWSQERRPNRLEIKNTTLSSSSRITIQTKKEFVYNLTGREIAGMAIIMRGMRFGGTYSAQMHLGLGNWVQSGVGNGAPSLRAGSWNRFFGGSSNTGAQAYNASNTANYVYKDWGVSNPNWGVDKKSGDTFGAFVRRTPSNVQQNSGAVWRWEAGTIWNGTVDIWSRSPVPGKSVDISSLCGMSSATNWGGYFSVRGQNSNMQITFEALELWVAVH